MHHHGRRRAAIIAGIAVVALAACAREERESGAEHRPESTPGGARTALIAGTWMRAAPGGGGGRQGLTFTRDGAFRLVGIVRMAGVSWSLSGDSLAVTTNSQRYPEPGEIRFLLAELTPSVLTLAGPGYLAGTYERDDGAAGTVTGTVNHRQPMPLPAEAVVEVTLRDISRPDAPAAIVAFEVIPAGDRRLPIPFRLVYPVDTIEELHTYAITARISTGGRLRFINTSVQRVITQGHPSQIEIWVDPV